MVDTKAVLSKEGSCGRGKRVVTPARVVHARLGGNGTLMLSYSEYGA